MTLINKLNELHEYLKEYGEVSNHSECEIAGHTDTITSYRLEGKRISISTHDGEVTRIFM
jgi:hypothetical protein